MPRYPRAIERVIGFIVAAGFGFMVWTGSTYVVETLEMKTYDLRAKLGASGERNPDIELVVITEEDLSALGQLPWPRDILAAGIENLAMAGAKVIALDFLLTEPEESEGLKAVRRLKETYEATGLAQTEPGRMFYEELSQADTDLDHDTILHQAFERAGNVALPVLFEARGSGRDQPIPDFLREDALNPDFRTGSEEESFPGMRMFRMRPVLPFLAESAATVGHINQFPDDDGTVRRMSHLICFQKEACIPSLALAVVAWYKDVADGDITVAPGEGIRWTGPSSPTIRVPLTEAGSTLIRWNEGPNVVFHQTPFSKVLKNDVETSLFRDKVVLIGGWAGTGTNLKTPIADNLPRLEILANAVANVLTRSFVTRPPWAFLVEFCAVIIFGLVLLLLLPGMRSGAAVLTTLILIAAYGGAASALFVHWGLWIQVAAPVLLLVVGCGLLLVWRAAVGKEARGALDGASYETNKAVGLSFLKQGRLDSAFQKLRNLPAQEEEVKSLLYDLGIAYERKRQFEKALEVYELATADGRSYGDLDERIPRLVRAVAGTSGTVGRMDPGDTTLRMGELKRTIGRYEVIDELGRGAMGVVYKGEDPKIHRTVAIKTINMGQFDEDSLGKMRDRFFREAESAGLLAHQNTVTIYDCGEEGDLAYIAMEFLEGEDLLAYTDLDSLLPLRETLRVAADVAEALSYAHSKNIVHRDIKPANIMRLRGNHAVKVTDFGIARITSSSQTKTGVVLGTPSYMSPEQVSGKKVDGRSDIFSLGVVLFELLTGQKPFVGDDITMLMFKIAKEPHPHLRRINPRVPSVVEKIVDKALQKDLKKRYQRAEHMANHLRQVIARIDAVRAKQRTSA